MQKTKILLISADDSLVNSIANCLKQTDYQLVSTSHGLGAIELINHEKPSLIVLDVELPDFNSLAIIRSLRPAASHPIDEPHQHGYDGPDAGFGCWLGSSRHTKPTVHTRFYCP
jgi:CheY-like chemotaxis protein